MCVHTQRLIFWPNHSKICWANELGQPQFIIIDLRLCGRFCVCTCASVWDFVSLFRWLHLTSIYLLLTSKCRVNPPSAHRQPHTQSLMHRYTITLLSVCAVLKVSVCDIRLSWKKCLPLILSLTFCTKSEFHHLLSRCIVSLFHIVTESCHSAYAKWSHSDLSLGVCVCSCPFVPV